MLQRLHEKVHGWIAWLVVVLIGMTFVLWGVSYYQGSKAGGVSKATVNGEDISYREYDALYRRIKQQLSSVKQLNEQVLKENTMQTLVYGKVLGQIADKNGYLVSKEQVDKAIIAIPELQEDGQFSEQRFNQLLSSYQYTPTSFYQQVKEGMLNNQLRFTFVATDFTLPNELAAQVAQSEERRDYQYLILSEKLVKVKPPTEQQVKSYFNYHKQAFMTKESMSLSYVLLSQKAIADKIVITPQEIKQFYQENIDSYKRPAQFKIRQLYLAGNLTNTGQVSSALQSKINKVTESIKAGQSFEKIFKAYNEDLLATDGALPWMGLGTLDKAVDSKLVTLKKDEISPAIFTRQGVVFIQLVDKKPVEVRPLAEVSSLIKLTIKGERAQAEFEKQAEQMADVSYQSPDSLSDVADALNLKVLQTPVVTKDQLFAAPLNASVITNAAFSKEVAIDGNNSQPIQVSDDGLVVIRKNVFHPSTLKPLHTVQKDIEDILLKQERQKLLTAMGEELLKQLKQGDKQKVAAFIKKHGLAWISKSEKASAEDVINHYAFSMTKLKSSKALSQGFQSQQQGFVIITLNKVIPGELKTIPADRQTLLEKELANQQGQLSFDVYVQTQLKSAKVIMN